MRFRIDAAEGIRISLIDHIGRLYEALGWPDDLDPDDALAKADELYAELERLRSDPDAPRIWTEHDEEPPIGTVGRNRDGTVVWTRKDDGWHCDEDGCRNCPAEWGEVVGWGGTLTEETHAPDDVISTHPKAEA